MVAFELSLLVRALPRPKLVNAVKRTAESILSNGGHIEKIIYLGTQELPRKMLAHGQTNKKGSFFIIHYHAPSAATVDIQDFSKRDLDLIRPMHIKKEIPKYSQCLLDDEFKPPAYRSEVQLMMKEAQERLPKNIKKRQKTMEEVMTYPF